VVKSADRVLKVLEFFDDVQRPARAGEIARRLKMPQSSASVLLRSLVTLGYLNCEADNRRYLPSPRVALLGSWLGTGPARGGRLASLLQALSSATGDTIILAARNGLHAQYLHVVPARSALRFHVPQGTRRLLVRSATGYALLAASADPDEISSLVRRTNAEIGGKSLVTVTDVLEAVKAVRETGYALSRALVTPGAGSIAMPLPAEMDGVARPLAIANSGLLSDIDARQNMIIEAMRRVIDEPQSA
jgi:DNA-binding IclR family transcriptional regulator